MKLPVEDITSSKGLKYTLIGISLVSSVCLLHVLFNNPQDVASTKFSFFLSSGQNKIPDENMDFQLFSQEHNLQFSNINELNYRRFVWLLNLKRIDDHNKRYEKGLETFRMGMNQLTHLTPEDLENMLGCIDVSMATTNIEGADIAQNVTVKDFEQVPTVDWRDQGFVTEVKNQGSCGSCWAFSATGAIEGAVAKARSKLVSLSEQNLVDCTHGSWGNFGCKGGWPTKAYQYVIKNQGIDSETSYPYTGQDSWSCRFLRTIGAKITSFKSVNPTEKDLQYAVANNGPVSVIINANMQKLPHYQTGIYYDPYCYQYSQSLHAVLVVGYGSENGRDYWLVKNSWGKGWGDQGYIKMARNYNNMCNIATWASYPIA